MDDMNYRKSAYQSDDHGDRDVIDQSPPVYSPYDRHEQYVASPSIDSRYHAAFPPQQASFRYQPADNSLQSQRPQSNHDPYYRPDFYLRSDDAPTANQPVQWHLSNPSLSAEGYPKFLPVAIPQMTKGRGMPFMRLNSPALQEHGISETDFIEFIDTLNIVSAASPPFKVLDLAGGIIGMVPHHWAQLTSNLLKLTAMGGTAIVSKSRTDAFLQEANQRIFGPKGLRVCLITTAALVPSIKFPAQKAITLPLASDIPLESQPSFHNRLLQGLKGYVSQTEVTRLPSKKEDISVIDQMSAKQVARDMEKIDKQILKDTEKRMKKLQRHQEPWKPSSEGEISSGTVSGPPVRSRSLERKMRKVEHDIEKVNEKASRKMRKERHSSGRVEDERQDALLDLENKRERLLEKEAKRAQRSSSRKHEKDGKGADEKMTEKLLWIYIDTAFDESRLEM